MYELKKNKQVYMVIVEHLENTDENNEESMKNLRRPHAETPDAPGDSAFTGLPSHSPPRNRVAGPARAGPGGGGAGRILRLQDVRPGQREP